MWLEERWPCIAKHSNVCFIYNIKFKSSLWTPSQNSFLHVFKPIPHFIVLSPVCNKPIFMLQKYHNHTTIPFSNAYIYHTHIINPFFMHIQWVNLILGMWFVNNKETRLIFLEREWWWRECKDGYERWKKMEMAMHLGLHAHGERKETNWRWV